MDEKNIYLFLSSDDSKNYHPDNVAHSFTVELPERVNLDGNWMIALCDIYTEDLITETLYLYSDICDYSYIKNSLEPVLRMIFPSNNHGQYFSEKYYIPIRAKTLGRIKVYIRDRSMNVPDSFSKRIALTFHLKRRDG